MIEESFSKGDSFLHKANPSVKIVSAVALILAVALSRSFLPVIAGLPISLALFISARLEGAIVLRRILAVNFFIGFLWLTLPFTYGGDTMIPFGVVMVSGEGVKTAALITLKSNCIFFLFLSLIATSTAVELGHGLEVLRVPPKLCFLILFSYRYLFMISQEYNRLARAARLRCFRPRTNVHTYRTYAYLFAMTLVKSWNQAQRVRNAMILRGFNGRLYTLHEQVVSPADKVLLILMVLMAAAIGFVF